MAASNGTTRKRPPRGSLPIDETEWSGDHEQIKEGIDARPFDDVRIDQEGNVWAEDLNGTWTNYGSASDYTGSGRPAGRRGKDREQAKKRGR